MRIMGREGEKMGEEWGGMEGRRTGNGEEGKEGKGKEKRVMEIGGKEEKNGEGERKGRREKNGEEREGRRGENGGREKGGRKTGRARRKMQVMTLTTTKCFCDIEFRIRLPAIMYVPFFIPNYYHVSVRAWEIFSAGAHYLNDITPPPSYKKKLLMPFSAIIILWLTFGALVHLGFTLHLASGDRVAAGCIVAGRLACGVAVVCGVGGCVYGKGWLVVAEVVV